MNLPLVSPPKPTSVWADCHCSRDRISPGDHPACKHPSPRPRMVINGVRLSHNKSNWVGYLCRREIYTSSYLMWLFYWVLSAVRMPFIYLFICLLIEEEQEAGQHSPVRWDPKKRASTFALPFPTLGFGGEPRPDVSLLLKNIRICLIPEIFRAAWTMSLVDTKVRV